MLSVGAACCLLLVSVHHHQFEYHQQSTDNMGTSADIDGLCLRFLELFLISQGIILIFRSVSFVLSVVGCLCCLLAVLVVVLSVLLSVNNNSYIEIAVCVGGCRWWLSVVVVCGGCLWWLSVMVVCDGCLWWLSVMVVCDGCLWCCM